MHLALVAEGPSVLLEAYTDADGRFSFGDLPAHKFSLWANRRFQQAGIANPISLANGSQAQTIWVLEPERLFWINDPMLARAAFLVQPWEGQAWPNPVAAGHPLLLSGWQALWGTRLCLVDAQGKRTMLEAYPSNQLLQIELPESLPTGIYSLQFLQASSPSPTIQIAVMK
jgi:hypothetical protein